MPLLPFRFGRTLMRWISLPAMGLACLAGCSDVTQPPILPTTLPPTVDLSPLFEVENKLTPSDGAADDWFGWSVAIGDDQALVGAWRDDDNGPESGSAYVFERSGTGWNQVAKLTGSDVGDVDRFGWSVAISGDLALVGAPHVGHQGAAYVFDGSAGWSEVAKLTPSDGAFDDQFGTSVAISGDLAVIGALRDDDNGSESGSAYVFERSGAGWNQIAKLTASDGAAFDFFGWTVAISGNLAVVSAPQDDDKGDLSGSAYVFDGSAGWSQVAKLTASDGAAFDLFGEGVGISGDLAVVGAQGADVNGLEAGAAYVFDGSAGWSQVAKLTASDAAEGDGFGRSVAISGDLALVGAQADDDKGNFSGSAYVFERSGTGWSQVAKLTASDGADGDALGFSVAISGNRALVGSPNDDDNGPESGSAYVFHGSATPEDVVEDMIVEVDDLVADGELNQGQGEALTIKLDTALEKVAAGQDKVAINLLNAFINQVEDYVATGVLSQEKGESLIEQAKSVIEELST